MSTKTQRLTPIAVVEQRLKTIQAHWSAAERQKRAEKGRDRSRELFALLLAAVREESDICAVGAPACEDWRRLAG